MVDITVKLSDAVKNGNLLKSSQENITQFLNTSSSPISEKSILELIESNHWNELNDRFFKTLVFGTGGLRGRTIGKTITSAEQGNGGPNDRPEHPCVGSATMNFTNLSRAIRGMIIYLQNLLPG